MSYKPVLQYIEVHLGTKNGLIRLFYYHVSHYPVETVLEKIAKLPKFLQADLKKLAANLESLECLMRAPFPDDDDEGNNAEEDKVEIENERSSEVDPVSILVTAPSYESLLEAGNAGKGNFAFSTLSPGVY